MRIFSPLFSEAFILASADAISMSPTSLWVSTHLPPRSVSSTTFTGFHINPSPWFMVRSGCSGVTSERVIIRATIIIASTTSVGIAYLQNSSMPFDTPR